MNIIACSVAVDVATTERGLEIVQMNHDIVRNFAGIHPEAAGREDLDAFCNVFSQNIDKIDGIGEIGLDKIYEERGIVPYDRQKVVFDEMVRLAESNGKPVSIHSRKALDDILQMLPSYRLKSVLLHWFAGSKKQLAQAADMGLYVSFGPALVYSDDKRVLLQHAPRDRILVETDGPVSYSRCFEDLPAASTSFLVSVVSSAAKVLGMNFDEAGALFEVNSNAYLSP